MHARRGVRGGVPEGDPPGVDRADEQVRLRPAARQAPREPLGLEHVGADRRDRDVVRKPGTTAKPKPDKSEKETKPPPDKDGPPAVKSTDKPKSDKGDNAQKPFVDKTLNKALDYLRGEIKKVGAAPHLDEARLG